MGARGVDPTEGRKNFNKFIEFDHIKLKKTIIFHKFHEFLRGFRKKYNNN